SPDRIRDARSESTERRDHRYRDLQPTECPASPGPHTWLGRTRGDSAENPDLHFVESASRHFEPLVPPRLRRFAHGQHVKIRLAREPGVRDIRPVELRYSLLKNPFIPIVFCFPSTVLPSVRAGEISAFGQWQGDTLLSAMRG